MIDNVTLLQIARGAKIYRCRFYRSPDAYTFKSMEKLERGQLVLVHMIGSPERPQKGSQRNPRAMKKWADEEDTDSNGFQMVYEEEVARPGFAVARVIEEVADFEPSPGITYCWVVSKLNEGELNRLPDWDKQCRNKMRLGAAIREAETAVKGLDLDPLPPSSQIVDASALNPSPLMQEDWRTRAKPSDPDEGIPF